jgi:hypothetical protein
MMTGGGPTEWEIMLEALSLDVSDLYGPFLGWPEPVIEALRDCARSFLTESNSVPASEVGDYLLGGAEGREHPYRAQLMPRESWAAASRRPGVSRLSSGAMGWAEESARRNETYHAGPRRRAGSAVGLALPVYESSKETPAVIRGPPAA